MGGEGLTICIFQQWPLPIYLIRPIHHTITLDTTCWFCPWEDATAALPRGYCVSSPGIPCIVPFPAPLHHAWWLDR